MSQRSPERNIEELLSSGPPTEWYAGYGRIDTGIIGIWYSEVFSKLAGGQVNNHFVDWCHHRIRLRLGIVSAESGEVQKILERARVEVGRLSGFSPEDILDKKDALLETFAGHMDAPFKTYLVEPIDIPDQPPPMEWFMGFARRDKGILRVTFSDTLCAMEKGEVGKQLTNWTHYDGNPITTLHSKERKERAMEITLYAGYYVKSTTGYYPEDLMAQLKSLGDLYEGQYTAPFEIEYVD